MRAGFVAAIVAACLCGGNFGWAACPAERSRGHARDCVNFGLVPQISEQIVAREHIVVPRKAEPPKTAPTSYTGPTVRVAPNLRRAPEIGYRWAIN
jgi:hypothetical protein